jgi:hypothetical protein
MAEDRATVKQAPEPGIGQPPRDFSHDVTLMEIAKLQSGGEYLKRDLSEMRTDMRDVRDRMARLEVRVDHLPTKGFIVAAVIASLTITGVFLAIAPKLQSFVATLPHISLAPTPPPVTTPGHSN